MVNEGHNYIVDVVNADLEKIVSDGHLRATARFDELAICDVIAICVPTPLDVFKQPDLTYVINSTENVAERLHKGNGTRARIHHIPRNHRRCHETILEETGLVCGKDFISPSVPKELIRHLDTKRNTPKVVGGVGPGESTEVAKLLYESVLDAENVFVVSSPKESGDDKDSREYIQDSKHSPD